MGPRKLLVRLNADGITRNGTLRYNNKVLSWVHVAIFWLFTTAPNRIVTLKDYRYQCVWNAVGILKTIASTQEASILCLGKSVRRVHHCTRNEARSYVVLDPWPTTTA